MAPVARLTPLHSLVGWQHPQAAKSGKPAEMITGLGRQCLQKRIPVLYFTEARVELLKDVFHCQAKPHQNVSTFVHGDFSELSVAQSPHNSHSLFVTYCWGVF